MKICTLASGSSGNCTLVWHNSTYILIDAGISMRRIVKSMKELGLEPEDLSAVLITHEHSDHINGVPMLVKHFGLRVLASGGTARAIAESGKLFARQISVFQTGEPFLIGDLEVNSFETPHDTAESVGFTLDSGKRRFAYATDLGHVTPEVTRALSGAQAVVLESNHDVDMLKCGAYPYNIKMRILGGRGHLSNPASSELSARLAAEGTQSIVLAHLSEENNKPETALHAAENAIRNAGLRIGQDIKVAVARPDALSDVIEL